MNFNDDFIGGMSVMGGFIRGSKSVLWSFCVITGLSFVGLLLPTFDGTTSDSTLTFFSGVTEITAENRPWIGAAFALTGAVMVAIMLSIGGLLAFAFLALPFIAAHQAVKAWRREPVDRRQDCAIVAGAVVMLAVNLVIFPVVSVFGLLDVALMVGIAAGGWRLWAAMKTK